MDDKTKKVFNLTGAALDYWVAKAGDTPFYDMGTNWPGNHHVNTEQLERPVIIRGLTGNLSLEYRNKVERFEPSTNWAHGGPIIERVGILIRPSGWHGDKITLWAAFCYDWAHGENYGQTGESPLLAAMRSYVRSKFGEEVPDANS